MFAKGLSAAFWRKLATRAKRMPDCISSATVTGIVTAGEVNEFGFGV